LTGENGRRAEVRTPMAIPWRPGIAEGRENQEKEGKEDRREKGMRESETWVSWRRMKEASRDRTILRRNWSLREVAGEGERPLIFQEMMAGGGKVRVREEGREGGVGREWSGLRGKTIIP